MPDITLTDVSKSYGTGPAAVTDLNLTVPDGSFTCLLGPSGCGKTTTLRMIAGLEHPTAGAISVGGRVLDSVERGVFVPPERREMGLVFQNYALWPHLTVARNVEFGLRVRRMPARKRAERVRQALTAMQIDWAADRYPAQLSGGQQQRVSLARMLAVDPKVLLLDEPLSNLDAQLRLEMRAELKRLHAETGQTIVFVTHDQLEAMTMATHVAVLNKGVLQQLAAPMEVYRRPANRFVGGFVGSPPMNLIELGDTRSGTEVRRQLDRLRPELLPRVAAVGVRPEAIRIAESGPADDWVFEASVGAVLPTGSSWTVSVTPTSGTDPSASAPVDGGPELYLVSYQDVAATTGARVRCRVSADDLHLFDDDGARIATAPAPAVAP
ncbi:ABC transporter ATP-binding protein [Actinocatenispora comari]|jgi:iron(III) transport system ATP-binding protein|uniref:ABC transporter ATP-binding protein n=1 Tax=Actinocatenispora comari TaxID=2807577 RepID=A0A8J4AIK8_9ACTN|nr:ABC transporter ATP-binding protein [Actinocatenispora comari]GIL29987.1 ABC transporter ATP-binding protein [Actinocatenispora comari]